MKSLRLADREKGSEFCRFERDLIFDPQNRDVGYVRYLDGRTFRLVKSRFTDIDSGITYVLPTDGSLTVDEGAFVRIEVERMVKDHRLHSDNRGKGLVGESIIYAEVGNFSQAKIPLPPPELPVDEFLYRVSKAWKNAEEDYLHYIIALLMVSSPRSILGEGGLGSEGIQRVRAMMKGTNRDLANTILSQLPLEFRTSGTHQYKYSKIESIGDIKLINEKRVSENCYSLVPEKIYEAMIERNIPIQLPFVIRNSELTKIETPIDLDILDYQLTSLYVPPPSEKIQEETFQVVMNKLKNEEFWDLASMGELDRNAGLKINMAFSRLFIGRSFDGRDYKAGMTDIDKGVDIFKRIMSYGFENIRLKVKEEDYFRSRRTEPWRAKLRSLDKEIYIHLRTLQDEQGSSQFQRDGIFPKINQFEVERALERLNRYGYILMLKNGSVIKLVRSDDPEDLS
jgi:hypothetical protein